MALFKQSSTAYRLNYLWYTKQEIASAINEVGKNKGISINPRQDFAKFAEKILKLTMSVWSSANDSEDPHLTITENGYYKVSDLSLAQFGDASAKTVVSSFYVNVQSAPIIIGGSNLEAGTITNRGNKSPIFDSNRTYTSDVISNFLLQGSSDLGFTYTTSGSDHTITFSNGIQMILSDDGTIKTVAGDYTVGSITDLNSNQIRVLQNENTVFFWVEHMSVNGSNWPSAISAFGLTKPKILEQETESTPKVVMVIIAGVNAEYAIREDGWDANVYADILTSNVNNVYGLSNDYIFYNLTAFDNIYHYPETGSSAMYQKDLGTNLFYGPRVPASDYPASCKLNNAEYISLMPNTNLWQRITE